MSDNWGAYLETPPTTIFGSLNSVGHSALTPVPVETYADPEIDTTKLNPTSMDALAPIQPFMFPPNIEYDNFNGELENRIVACSNVPQDVPIDELNAIFGAYGEIEKFDMTRLNMGTLLVHYYDIRSARWLRSSEFSIHGRPIIRAFAPSEEVKNPKKPPNCGTIVIFHLVTETTSQELEELFSQFGEIRQIRSTPQKQKQRFIEYFDKRSAERALTSMNGKCVRNSKINIEFSLPGGFRRNYTAPSGPTVERRHV